MGKKGDDRRRCGSRPGYLLFFFVQVQFRIPHSPCGLQLDKYKTTSGREDNGMKFRTRAVKAVR